MYKIFWVEDDYFEHREIPSPWTFSKKWTANWAAWWIRKFDSERRWVGNTTVLGIDGVWIKIEVRKIN